MIDSELDESADKAGWPPQLGGLYRLSANMSCSNLLSDIQISNGLCWSLDSKKMYFADSAQRQLYAYDFDQKIGKVSNKINFAATPEGVCPDGDVIQIFSIPAQNPSCLCFAGVNLDYLIVTTAMQGIAHENLDTDVDGSLLIYKAGVKGVGEAWFNLENRYLHDDLSLSETQP